MGVRQLHQLGRTGHRLQMRAQGHIARSPKAMQPFGGERLAGFALDARRFVTRGLADENLHALLQRQLPAALLQQIPQYAHGQRLAVHQHAIAIEQYGGKTLRHSCSPST